MCDTEEMFVTEVTQRRARAQGRGALTSGAPDPRGRPAAGGPDPLRRARPTGSPRVVLRIDYAPQDRKNARVR
jgi:hypothetical protein